MPYVYLYVYESIQKPHILLESRQRLACSRFRKILRLQWRTWDKSTYSNQIYSGHLEMQSVKLRSSKDPKRFGKILEARLNFAVATSSGTGIPLPWSNCMMFVSEIIPNSRICQLVFFASSRKNSLWCSSCECFIILFLIWLQTGTALIYGLATPKVPLVKSNEKHMPIHLTDSRKESNPQFCASELCSNMFQPTLWICSGEQ